MFNFIVGFLLGISVTLSIFALFISALKNDETCDR